MNRIRKKGEGGQKNWGSIKPFLIGACPLYELIFETTLEVVTLSFNSRIS